MDNLGLLLMAGVNECYYFVDVFLVLVLLHTVDVCAFYFVRCLLIASGCLCFAGRLVITCCILLGLMIC